MTALILILAALLLPGLPIPVAEANIPPQLQRLRATYERYLDEDLGPIKDAYEQQLANLLRLYETRNRPEEALAVRQRLAALRGRPVPSGALPERMPREIETIDQDYQRRARSARDPIDAWYREQLTTLRAFFDGEGDVTAVSALDDARAEHQHEVERAFLPPQEQLSMEGLVIHFNAERSGPRFENLASPGGRGVGYSVDIIDDHERGKAYNFNGSDSSLIIADMPGIQLHRDITLAAWIRSPLTQRGTIFNKCSNYEFDLGMWRGGRLYFHHGDGRWEGPGHIPAGIIKENEWTHIAIIRTIADRKVDFYVDGRLVRTWKYDRLPEVSEKPIVIGERRERVTPFRYLGQMDDLLIFNHAMSDRDLGLIIKTTGR